MTAPVRDREILLSWLSVATAVLSVLVGFASAIGAATMFDEGWRGFNTWEALVGAVALSGMAATFALMWARASLRRRKRGQVFIVHASEDLEAARQIGGFLNERGYRAWIGADQILPGQVWMDAIRDAFEQSAIVVVLVSDHARESTFVRNEVEAALKGKRSGDPSTTPVIPVRLDGTVPWEPLSAIQWVDWGEPEARSRLLRGVELASRFAA
jgi:hypothetical protein